MLKIRQALLILTWRNANFKKGIEFAPFANIQIYPLTVNILGLTITPKIDVNLKIKKQIV